MMIRLIRYAAMIGMGLSLIEFLWVFVEIRYSIHSDMLRDIKSFKDGVHDLLREIHVPSEWFCFAGILYVLTRMVPTNRAEKPSA